MKSLFTSLVITTLALSHSHAPAKEVSSKRKIKPSEKVRRSETSPAPPTTKTAPAEGPFSMVVIDAGHGGHDPGGIQENLFPEKDLALDTALRLSYVLEDAGLKTVLTRRDDVFVTLEDRVAAGNAQDNALFVSIHFNSSPRREARGIETYYSKTSGGAALASIIQQRLVALTGTPDRGVKSADFYVLRKAKGMSILVECGFLTNPEDVAQALDNELRQKFADEIGAAILQYRNALQLTGSLAKNERR